jgi:NADH-ubiquinone oxidoreductase chain 2
MIYGFTGVTNFEELAKIFTRYKITLFGAQSSGIFMGILFIAIGFLFKITANPFHMWAPDVTFQFFKYVFFSYFINPKTHVKFI